MKQPILYLRCNVSDGDLEEKCIQCGKTKCGAGFCRTQNDDQGASVDAQGQVLYHCWHTSALWRIVYTATQVEGGEKVEALTSVATKRWLLFDLTLPPFFSQYFSLSNMFVANDYCPHYHWIYQELRFTCFLLTAIPLTKHQTPTQLVAGDQNLIFQDLIHATS